MNERCGYCAVLLVLGVLSSGQAQPPKADPNQELHRILGELKDQAEAQKKEDRRRALLLIQQAQTAEQAGQLADALNLAQKAERLFGESNDIKQYTKYLAQQQKGQRDLAIRQAVVQRRLEEALDRVDELLRTAQPHQARDLLEAVREGLTLLPAGVEIDKLRKAAEKMLRDLKPREPEPDLEVLPAPMRTDPPAAQPVVPAIVVNDGLKRALMQRVSVNWKDHSLSIALLELGHLGNVPILLDPILEAPSPAPQVRLNLRIYQGSIDRILRLLAEMTGGGYILVDGQVVFTTKAKALEFALTGKYGNTEIVAPGGALRPVIGVLPKPASPPPAPKLPDYLQSGKALREHLREVLEVEMP
jgi:hypothetical protein